MALAVGDRFGPYEIIGPLGAGGMGEVYRARDARLNREVALKVLPAAFAQDPERVARFEREAKLLASLNHPRIGALYGLEESEGRRVLVLELVAGESLAERLRRGALPLDEALPVACQVASALEAAHESGVVHRDLKPGNVMLRPDGSVKVLDFGLAKGGATEQGSADANLSASPTMTYAATEAGVILGTAAYMSPEQARGRAVDRRSDIWSFGCLLFELLTGRQAFPGDTVSDTLAAILKSEPDWGALPAHTPRRVSDLVRRCLRKDPSSRLRDAGDARIELEEVIATPDGAQDAHDADGTRAGARGAAPGRVVVVAMSAALVLALAFAGWTLLRGAGAQGGGAQLRFAVAAPAGVTPNYSTEAFAIAPDGGTVAFVGQDSSGTSAVWLRRLDTLAAERVPGTENAIGLFWSPDGRALAVFADGKLKKVVLAGGAPQVLCEAPDPRGGTWGREGTIVFAPQAVGPLCAVSADGGDVAEIVRPDSVKHETGVRFPQFLPDGRHFLFVSMPHPQGKYAIWVAQLGSPARKQVMLAGAVPVWAGAGRILTVLNDHLVAQDFDPGSGTLHGKAADLGDAPLVLGHDGCNAVSASRDGKLAYCSGSLANTRLVWLDRAGNPRGAVPVPAGRWETFALSPDGARVAIGRRLSASETDVWILDLATGQGSPIGTSSSEAGIVWSPDGRSVAYQKNADGYDVIYVQPADGGAGRPLVPPRGIFENPSQWSPDGTSILFAQPNPGTNWDLMLAPVDGSHPPARVAASPANEMAGVISPDSRWLIYTSDESGRVGMYARPLASPGPRQQVQIGTSGFNGIASTNGFDWSGDGRELVVMASDVMAYAVQAGDALRIGAPRRLFAMPAAAITLAPSRDHQRFLVTLPVADGPPPALAVEANWAAALRRR